MRDSLGFFYSPSRLGEIEIFGGPKSLWRNNQADILIPLSEYIVFSGPQ
jgi:hypothetical protein